MPATQALRSEQLLEWAETEGGCGLRAIKTLVDKINQDDQ
jgi:hypothetical protein